MGVGKARGACQRCKRCAWYKWDTTSLPLNFRGGRIPLAYLRNEDSMRCQSCACLNADHKNLGPCSLAPGAYPGQQQLTDEEYFHARDFKHQTHFGSDTNNGRGKLRLVSAEDSNSPFAN